MTKEQFQAIEKVLNEAGCDWSIEYDNYGQVVIYTGVEGCPDPNIPLPRPARLRPKRMADTRS